MTTEAQQTLLKQVKAGARLTKAAGGLSATRGAPAWSLQVGRSVSTVTPATAERLVAAGLLVGREERSGLTVWTVKEQN